MSYKDVLSYNNFRTGSAWLFLILGIGLYILGYFVSNPDNIWKEIFIKVGDVLVIGVLIGYLSNAAQFLGIFKKDLHDIIYGKEFLYKRKDLDQVWETVSKGMFKNKFPSIHKELLKTINGYFPNEAISYFHNYDIDIIVEWEDRSTGIIKVTEDVSYDLIADSEDKFEHQFSTASTITDEATCKTEIKLIQVNQKDPKVVSDKHYKENECICHKIAIALKGSKKYAIHFIREKTYCIYDDYFIGFYARYIVDDLKVSLEHPEDIAVSFVHRGTQEKYEDLKINNKKISKKYKGIILPKQGYIFALMPKS